MDNSQGCKSKWQQASEKMFKLTSSRMRENKKTMRYHLSAHSLVQLKCECYVFSSSCHRNNCFFSQDGLGKALEPHSVWVMCPCPLAGAGRKGGRQTQAVSRRKGILAPGLEQALPQASAGPWTVPPWPMGTWSEHSDTFQQLGRAILLLLNRIKMRGFCFVGIISFSQQLIFTLFYKSIYLQQKQ